jgi:hypothetical protein
MKIVERKDINEEKWNEIVAKSAVQNPLLYSWALDATSVHWCAIIANNFDFIFPIPYEINLGVKRARQQVFSRQMDFIGDASCFPEALEIARKEFHTFDLRLSECTWGIANQEFQRLDLSKPIDYKINARRKIKKSDEIYKYELSNDPHTLLAMYAKNSFLKFKQPLANIERLEQLMLAFLSHNKGYVLNAVKDYKIQGAIFVIEDKLTDYYLIGDGPESSKKNGAIYGLMNQAIVRAQAKKMKYFDFGGSNVASVATFYRKFGAENCNYSRIYWNNAPFWFKLIQKVKKWT